MKPEFIFKGILIIIGMTLPYIAFGYLIYLNWYLSACILAGLNIFLIIQTFARISWRIWRMGNAIGYGIARKEIEEGKDCATKSR